MGHMWGVTHCSLSTDTRSAWEMEPLMDSMTDWSLLSLDRLDAVLFSALSRSRSRLLVTYCNGVALKNTELCLSRLAPCQDSHLLLQVRKMTSYLSLLALTLVEELVAGSSAFHMAWLVWQPDSNLVNSKVGVGRSWTHICVVVAQNELFWKCSVVPILSALNCFVAKWA